MADLYPLPYLIALKAVSSELVSILRASGYRLHQPLQLAQAKTQIASWKTKAAIVGSVQICRFIVIADLVDQATFLAAVQTQTLSFSIQNNSTHLLIATNTFAFTSVILDVVGAFLAIQSSMLGQAHTDRIDSLHDELLGCTAEELRPVIIQLRQFLRERRAMTTHSLVYHFLMKAIMHLEKLGRDPSQSGPNGIDNQLRLAPNLTDVIESAETIVRVSTVGEAAEIATRLGILCFLASVMCLAIATQPPSVWILAVAAYSCIITLPMLNKLVSWGFAGQVHVFGFSIAYTVLNRPTVQPM